MATLEQNNKKIVTFVDPRPGKRILTAEEGEAFERRLAEPGREPTPAMLEAVRIHKRLMSEPKRSAR
jgi:hypothetical protein